MSPASVVKARFRDDTGTTLTELLVAIGIFTMVLVVALSATVLMSGQAARTQVTSDTASQLRTVFQRMDKEVRYASAINAPGVSGGNIYVEYLIPEAATSGVAKCVQWRYVTGSKELQRREWTPGTDADVSTWSTMATNLLNDLSDPNQQPFALHKAGPSGSKVYLRQGLNIYLDAGLRDAQHAAGSQLDVYMVANNSSAASISNDSGGTKVCLVGVAQRP